MAQVYNPHRARLVRILIGEAALWAAPGGGDVQAGQLGKLETVASLPTVELGVVPLRRMPVLPLSGFRVLYSRFSGTSPNAGARRRRPGAGYCAM